MSHQHFRKGLSASGMYSLLHSKSLAVPDIRSQRPHRIPLSDAIMSSVAMFALKDPSMLQFCDRVHDPMPFP